MVAEQIVLCFLVACAGYNIFQLHQIEESVSQLQAIELNFKCETLDLNMDDKHD